MFNCPFSATHFVAEGGDAQSVEGALLNNLVVGWWKPVDIIGEHATQWDFGTSIELIRSKKVDMTSLITHTMPLAKGLEAMHLAMTSSDAVKVVLTND